MDFTNWKLWFSIVLLVYQRVYAVSICKCCMIGSRDVQMQRQYEGGTCQYMRWRSLEVEYLFPWRVKFQQISPVFIRKFCFRSDKELELNDMPTVWGTSANLVRKAHNAGCLLDELVTTNKHNCGAQIAPYLSISYHVSGWDKHYIINYNDLDIRI